MRQPEVRLEIQVWQILIERWTLDTPNPTSLARHFDVYEGDIHLEGTQQIQFSTRETQIGD